MIKKLTDPEVTLEEVKSIVKFVSIPLDTFIALGQLLVPQQYEATTAGQLLAMGRTMNAALDAAFQEAQVSPKESAP